MCHEGAAVKRSVWMISGLCLLLAMGQASAEPTVAVGEPSPAGVQWTVQVDPLTTALGLVHVQVERRLGPDWSVYVGPQLRLFDGLLETSPQPYIGLGVEAGVRHFFAGHAPTGCWVMARGVVARLSTTGEAAPQVSIGGYGSVLVGYTGVVKGRLVLSGGLGGQYMAYKVGEYGFGGFIPAAHTALGLAF